MRPLKTQQEKGMILKKSKGMLAYCLKLGNDLLVGYKNDL